MQQITPFLWFDSQAEEAAHYYVSLFKNSRILNISRYGEAGPGPAGSVMVVDFELNGQRFNALNGGPVFKFTEAISFSITCDTQAEVDEYWEKLSRGGQPGPCGWLKDRYGLSWQIVPAGIQDVVSGGDPKKAAKAMAAMMKMGKLDLAALKRAREE